MIVRIILAVWLLYAGPRLGCPAPQRRRNTAQIAHHALRQVVLIAVAVHKIRRHAGGARPVDAGLFIVEKEAFARLYAQRVRCDAVSLYMRLGCADDRRRTSGVDRVSQSRRL